MNLLFLFATLTLANLTWAAITNEPRKWSRAVERSFFQGVALFCVFMMK